MIRISSTLLIVAASAGLTPAIAQQGNPCRSLTASERQALRGDTPGIGCRTNDTTAAYAAEQTARPTKRRKLENR